MTQRSDIAIVGGGPVGASLALALAGSGLSVTMLEAKTEVAADPRALALSYGTRQILRQLGAWLPDEAATAIATVHISQQGGFGRAELSAQESGIPALGYVANYPDLARTLRQKLAAAPVRFLAGTEATAVTVSDEAAEIAYVHDGQACALAAKLLVLADGGRSLGDLPGMKLSVRDYRQCALLARVKTDQPHRNRAFERFTAKGPIALLPSGGEWALVWTVAAEEAEILGALDDKAFLAALQQRFGQRAGRFLGVRERGNFPLALKQTRPVTGPR
ncbi:MAG: FAD-dependent monooxygenase, partial [Sulfuricellaceae bacterium]|nr:FAD-dependent monooxygenase [Sulfuricellaceae bacterium]